MNVSSSHSTTESSDFTTAPDSFALSLDRGRLPRHIAVVMDGNGRWAKARHLPRSIGHQRGRRAVRRLIELASRAQIPVLTLFAFSSENWSRPPEEVEALMGLFAYALERDMDELHAHAVRIRFIGDREPLSARIRTLMIQAEQQTEYNTGLNLLIAVSYGGQWDILHAAKQLASAVLEGVIRLDDDPAALRLVFEQNLSTATYPPVDLFIRTGGEQRVSNFLLWQLAYAELYFTDCLWPGFDEAHFRDALQWYAARERRFGGLDE
ncbi:polyprenyl diphosphate synthase [Halothiobacillus sp.]|uniref:polyprenyl diphosphate synthase n=1 Tax=Halothiobacillus sp. TaxID=1891311 RepID=UPI002AD4F465|nr:polyprenyl diphosphate synthase [Halothiobacillus sp.]